MASESANPQNIQIPPPREYLMLEAGGNYKILNRIATCESNWRPNAVNTESNASGIFQFLPSTWVHWGHGNPFDPYENINAALKLFEKEGTRPWTASEKCWSVP